MVVRNQETRNSNSKKNLNFLAERVGKKKLSFLTFTIIIILQGQRKTAGGSVAFKMAGLSELIPGWTENVDPQGQLYWYNASLQQSTYACPSNLLGGFTGQIGGQQMPLYTGPPPSAPSSSTNPQSDSHSSLASSSKPKVKKEKPAKKEAIPGADGWLRVTTTLGNIFFTHVESKRSEWTVPDEIKDQVEAMQEEKRGIKVLEEEEARLAKEQQEEEKRQAREEENCKRLQKEEEEREKCLKELRLREEAVLRQRKEREKIQEERLRILQEQGKRKRQDESVGSEEAGLEQGDVDKKARLDAQVDDDDEDEESWQRQMAAEMAAAAEREEEDEATSFVDEQSSESPANNDAGASKLDLSVEEGKALFIHMLTSLNGTPNEVNPMAPWDRELPKFIHHRDYTVLNSLRDRQDAFNEWCKLRLREKRNKAKQNIPSEKAVQSHDNATKAESNGHGETKKESESEVAYRALLENEVKSTRTKWEDFKKSWRKDRRFFAYGRDDRERERFFRGWLKELGEKKRVVAEQAEDDFVALLDEFLGQDYRLESGVSIEDTQAAWTKARRFPGLDKDARYEAVGSSSRRAEIFGEWAKGRKRREKQINDEAEVEEGQVSPKEFNAINHGTDRALREREEAVERKRRELESRNRRAFGQATREENLISFRQLLADAIRDPLVSHSRAMHLLSSDGRFDTPGIRTSEKEQLVHQHLLTLNNRRLEELHGVFEKYAPALDIEAKVALPLIKNDDELQRRKMDQIQVIQSGRKNIDDLFHEWKREQEQEAIAAFQQMLKENAFINFWGGLRQEHEQRKRKERENDDEKPNGTRQGEDEEDDDEPDLLQMAGNVDLEEIHSILRVRLFIVITLQV